MLEMIQLELLDQDSPKGGSGVTKDVGLSLPSAAALDY